MTPAEFEALLDTLPSGLHDADLGSLTVDFAAAEVACVLNADLSDPDDPATEGTYRPARLVFKGVSFVVIEARSVDVAMLPGWIDGGSGSPSTVPRPELAASSGGFLAWIYLQSTGGFIRIGARGASLEWLPDRPPTPQPLA
jgi:hypothetical protein